MAFSWRMPSMCVLSADNRIDFKSHGRFANQFRWIASQVLVLAIGQLPMKTWSRIFFIHLFVQHSCVFVELCVRMSNCQMIEQSMLNGRVTIISMHEEIYSRMGKIAVSKSHNTTEMGKPQQMRWPTTIDMIVSICEQVHFMWKNVRPKRLFCTLPHSYQTLLILLKYSYFIAEAIISIQSLIWIDSGHQLERLDSLNEFAWQPHTISFY